MNEERYELSAMPSIGDPDANVRSVSKTIQESARDNWISVTMYLVSYIGSFTRMNK